MDSLQIAAEKEECVGWIRLNGRVTLENGDQLRAAGMFFLENGASLLKFEMSDCLFMDSTIMGVMAMLSLEAYKRKVPVEAVNVKDETMTLLKGLGVHRVMKFTVADTDDIGWKTVDVAYNKALDSKVILDAHKTLMEVDEDNVAKFEQVVACLEAEIGGGSDK